MRIFKDNNNPWQLDNKKWKQLLCWAQISNLLSIWPAFVYPLHTHSKHACHFDPDSGSNCLKMRKIWNFALQAKMFRKWICKSLRFWDNLTHFEAKKKHMYWFDRFGPHMGLIWLRLTEMGNALRVSYCIVQQPPRQNVLKFNLKQFQIWQSELSV